MNRVIERRYDMDWLRVIAFGLLIYFHAAVVFLPNGLPLIHNEQSSPGLQLFVAVSHQFRLALLFFVAGMGVCFALKRRDRRAFFRERHIRLLLPLVFGILVLVPPMVYLEKRFIGEFEGGFLAFYLAYFSQGVYPKGHLSWHHFWFLAYLYLFCLVSWPVISRLRQGRGREWFERVCRRLARGRSIYGLVIILVLFEVPLRAFFPGFRDLIHDWASFVHWLLIFLFGFGFASCPRLISRAERLRTGSLLLAVVATTSLFLVFWAPDGKGLTPLRGEAPTIAVYVLFCLLRMLCVWMWLLACTGYAARYLNAPSRLLEYLSRAAYPLFCVHLPVTVTLAFWVVPHPWGITEKYLLITIGTMAGSLGAYEIVRRVAWLRPCFGLPRTLEAPKG